jgi:uncharacterized SAM-binding protein YcdF (DUF218 family)
VKIKFWNLKIIASLWRFLRKVGGWVVLIWLIAYGLIWIWVASKVNIDTKKKSDVIVVLGARIYLQNQKINPCLWGRINRGVELYKLGYAPKIIVSGGVDKEDGTIEAVAMKEMAIKLGVAEDEIITESGSDSTYENLRNSQKIMEQNNLKTAIIVTEPFHTPRAALIANKLNFYYSVSPAYSSCWNDWKYFSRFLWREPLALVKYWFEGKI